MYKPGCKSLQLKAAGYAFRNDIDLTAFNFTAVFSLNSWMLKNPLESSAKLKCRQTKGSNLGFAGTDGS